MRDRFKEMCARCAAVGLEPGDVVYEASGGYWMLARVVGPSDQEPMVTLRVIASEGTWNGIEFRSGDEINRLPVSLRLSA